ncbi:hypothetical protein [Pararhizobium sp.]|uniref:hypothetical protein n=1 Tax=Pararhizobium sp. TaxID=1977563 RepID=UPI003D0AB825
MPVFATAGAKLYIGTAMDDTDEDLVEADFTSMVWTEITGLENLGSLGDTSQATTVSHIGRARDITLKGTRSAGTMEVVASINYADAGQLAAIAAEKSKVAFGFKLVFNDAPAVGASPKPSERKFAALIMSANEQLDGANDSMKLNISLAVNSNVVRKNASAT